MDRFPISFFYSHQSIKPLNHSTIKQLILFAMALLILFTAAVHAPNIVGAGLR